VTTILALDPKKRSDDQKKELADNIVGSGENWLTEMSTAQLKELFTLSRTAVGE